MRIVSESQISRCYGAQFTPDALRAIRAVLATHVEPFYSAVSGFARINNNGSADPEEASMVPVQAYSESASRDERNLQDIPATKIHPVHILAVAYGGSSMAGKDKGQNERKERSGDEGKHGGDPTVDLRCRAPLYTCVPCTPSCIPTFSSIVHFR